MKRKKVNSFNILTPEDKQYLRRVCRYLASLGMQDGSIEMDIDNSADFDFTEIDWDMRGVIFQTTIVPKYLMV